MCVATVFAVGALVGFLGWVVCWRMFLILYCFLLPSVVLRLCVQWRFLLDWWPGLCVGRCFYYVVFFLPSVCGDCVCSGGSSGTACLDCVLEDVSKTMLFSAA